MIYDIHFCICACIVIFAVLVSYYSKKSIPITQNTTFLVLTWAAFLAALTDAGGAFIMNNPSAVPYTINYLVNFLCVLFNNTTSFMFAVYCVAITDTIKTMNKYAKAALAVLTVIDVIIIGFTPFTNWVFYIDDNNLYNRHTALYVLYVTAACFLIYGACYVHYYRNVVDKEKQRDIKLFIIISMTSVLVQLLIPSILIQSFGIAICIMLIYSNIQRPQELENTETNTLNDIAFKQMLNARFAGNNLFYIVVIHINDAEFLRSAVGNDQLNGLLKSIAEYIYRLSSKSMLYIADNDKFFLAIEGNAYMIIEELLNEIKKRFTEPWKCGDMETILHAHICLIKCPDDAQNIQHIFDYAHCLNNKPHEGTCGIFYAEKLDINYKLRKNQIQNAIDYALHNDTFEVYYQPIVDGKTGRVVSAEALLRLNDPLMGFISPEEFIPVAEKNGNILRIGRMVFESVCRFINKEDITKKGIKYIEINLSVVQCMQQQLVDELLEIIDRYNVGEDQIVLEVTETVANYSPEMLTINMNRLSELGIGLALDDYGTGYSNMTFMLETPFNIVKLDKSIVWSSFSNQKSKIALADTIAMIKNLGMEIVAEGVETKEHADKLIEMECEYLQGYYFAKALPEREFIEMLDRNK